MKIAQHNFKPNELVEKESHNFFLTPITQISLIFCVDWSTQIGMSMNKFKFQEPSSEGDFRIRFLNEKNLLSERIFIQMNLVAYKL